MRLLLPRFLLTLLAVPLAFTGAMFAAATEGLEGRTVPALVGAVTFAAVVLAPTTRNAAARAAIILGVVGLACGLEAALRL